MVLLPYTLLREIGNRSGKNYITPLICENVD